MHSSLCKQYVKSLGLTPSGFDFTPSCIGTTNPSRTGLNPLNKASTCCYNFIYRLIEFMSKKSESMRRIHLPDVITSFIRALSSSIRKLMTKTPHLPDVVTPFIGVSSPWARNWITKHITLTWCHNFIYGSVEFMSKKSNHREHHKPTNQTRKRTHPTSDKGIPGSRVPGVIKCLIALYIYRHFLI